MRPPIFLTGLLLIAYLATGAKAWAEINTLPNLGELTIGSSREEEHQIGQAIMRNLRRAGAVVEDPLANSYLNQLGYRLLSVHPGTVESFRFFIVKDKDINAFALPGGYIGVNYGLILASETEDELAAVLAHEIAHVTQRHHARSYAQQSASQIPMIAAIIAAIIIGDSQLSQAAIAGSMAYTIEKQLTFTRSNEQEADRIGITLLADAGLSPHGMARFFKRLDDQSRLYGPQAPEFLRTHPVTQNRIADAQNRATQVPAQKPSDDNRYQFTKVRLEFIAHEQPKQLAQQYLRENDANKQKLLPKQYGRLLALIENKDYQAAYTLARQLEKNTDYPLAIKLAMADIMFYMDSTHVLGQYKELLQLYPNNSAVVDAYTSTLLKLNRAETAQAILNDFLKTETSNPFFYEKLARTESLLGNQAASHQAMAEHYYLMGQLPDAIKQLEMAVKISKIDFYRLNQVEARINVFKQELLQLQELEKNL